MGKDDQQSLVTFSAGGSVFKGWSSREVRRLALLSLLLIFWSLLCGVTGSTKSSPQSVSKLTKPGLSVGGAAICLSQKIFSFCVQYELVQCFSSGFFLHNDAQHGAEVYRTKQLDLFFCSQIQSEDCLTMLCSLLLTIFHIFFLAKVVLQMHH